MSAVGVRVRVRPLTLMVDRSADAESRWGRGGRRGAAALFCIDAGALRGMRSGAQAPGSPAAELHGRQRTH
jgi:hypothetical protein